MFVTFGTASEQSVSTAPSESRASGTQGAKVKKKRAQVAQACDWCRVHRTKCDSSRPCKNCVNRGEPCENSRGSDVRTFPHAYREIQRLATRVRELELTLEQVKHNAVTTTDDKGPAPATSAILPSPPSPARPEVETVAASPFTGSMLKPPKRLWEGIFASTTQSSPKQWYGPSSLFYFIGRMEAYMTRALQQPSADRTIWFKAANKTLPTTPSESDRATPAGRGTQEATGATRDTPRSGRGHHPPATAGEYLNAAQEEYFLGLFWHSHHCSLQILDESTFREHYRSLLLNPPPNTFRQPSALVDIMVALCIQYGRTDVGPDNDGGGICWRHYQRCRALLELELERPTLATLQSLVFAVVYLCCASFQNMAHQLLALSVRVGQMLGLHLVPPESMPWPERELRKRVWWTVYILEGKTCMKLGRPLCIDVALMPCSLPADDHELALRSSSSTAAVTLDGSTVTWLTYTRQTAMLVQAGQAVYAGFFDRSAEILGSAAKPSSSLYDDLAALDAAANVLERYMGQAGGLKAWVRDVPPAMKTQRVGDGVPFSADLSRLEIETFAPAWLQRQRLFLELSYHTVMINLHRPFIAFPTISSPPPSDPSTTATTTNAVTSPPSTRSTLAMSHALSAVRHSIAVTMLIRQVLVETDLLKGWQEAFQQQWNAAITMVGFLLAYPVTPAAADARTAAGVAIEVFEAFGKHFSVGSSAAYATRKLLSKADLLRGVGMGERSSFGLEQLSVIGELGGIATQIVPLGQPGVNTGAPSTELGDQPAEAFPTEMTNEEMEAAVREMLAGTMDMVYSADSFQPMGGPFPGGFQIGMDAWPPAYY